MPLPALEWWKNRAAPPNPPLAAPPLVVKEPLPAVEMSKNSVTPPSAPLTAPPLLVKEVWLPAVALLVNAINPLLPLLSTAATKFCAIPELFVIPTPLMVS